MGRNTEKGRTTSPLISPNVRSNGKTRLSVIDKNIIDEKKFLFSFTLFDRDHKLFNLGDESTKDGAVPGGWFLSLFDCFECVCDMKIYDLKGSSYDLHPVDWEFANTSPPTGLEQYELQQFRINKSKGRIVGFYIGNVFYVVWLDPHHNLTDSEGYGKAVFYRKPLSDYERLEKKCEEQRKEIMRLKGDLHAAEELLNERI